MTLLPARSSTFAASLGFLAGASLFSCRESSAYVPAQGNANAKRTLLVYMAAEFPAGFDACLMANLGVAYELRNVADVYIASEEVEPVVPAFDDLGEQLSKRTLSQSSHGSRSCERPRRHRGVRQARAK